MRFPAGHGLSLALALCQIAQARPAPADIEKRSSNIVDLYQNNGYSGRSWAYTGGWDECSELPDWLNDSISSIRVVFSDGCWFWTDSNCKGNSVYVSTDSPKSSLQYPFNDAISSFKCDTYGGYGNNGYGIPP